MFFFALLTWFSTYRNFCISSIKTSSSILFLFLWFFSFCFIKSRNSWWFSIIGQEKGVTLRFKKGLPDVLEQLERSDLISTSTLSRTPASWSTGGRKETWPDFRLTFCSPEDCIDFSVDVIFVRAVSRTGRNLVVQQTTWCGQASVFIASKWQNSSH